MSYLYIYIYVADSKQFAFNDQDQTLAVKGSAELAEFVVSP